MNDRKQNHRPDRREFLTKSAGSVGALALGGSILPAAASANERIRVGVVGTGSRGGSLMGWTHKLSQSHNLQITAVCDLWEKRRHQAAVRVAEWNGKPPAVCRTISELCDRSDVDVVLIATADFQHCYHAALAVQAGKDVYVEKPFGCDFEQVKRARDLIRGSDRIVQIGMQSRGADKYYQAAQLVQSGLLGQVTYVQIAEPIFQQRWRVPGAENSIQPGEIDWDEYLCYLPKDTPFDPRYIREFRLFWPFSSGPFCQWMSHRIDLVNLVLGKLPVSAVSAGGVFLWKDGRTNPDTVQCLLEYPGGVLVSYHMRMGNSQHGRACTFYGTTGTLELEKGLAYGNGGGGLVVQADNRDGVQNYRIDKSKQLQPKNNGGLILEDYSVDYLAHFFECVRTRQKPRGDVEAAYGQSVATILASESYRRGCKMLYDSASETIAPA